MSSIEEYKAFMATVKDHVDKGEKVLFVLGTEEQKKVNEWYRNHPCTRNKGAGVFGDSPTYRVAPTTVGTIVDVTCEHCKLALLDVTDLANNW